MKKYYIYILSLLVLCTLIACENPAYKDVLTEDEFKDTMFEQLGGLAGIVTTPARTPVCITFTEDAIEWSTERVDIQKNTWHLYAYDATWRFGSNSGTTATAEGSGGTGGVKVYKGVNFEDVTSINHTTGLVNADGNWETDKKWDYDGTALFEDLNLNYYLTDDLKTPNNIGSPSSGTYLFDFTGDMSSGSFYTAGTEFVFLIQAGTGGDWVKVQPISMETDGEGMTFNNRVYIFKYEMADSNGDFAGSN